MNSNHLPIAIEAVVFIPGERFPLLTREEIMALINVPTDHLRHTRLAQDWMAEGEARGPLSEATTAHIQALPLEQLESLTEA
jgi:hypothetical protein